MRVSENKRVKEMMNGGGKFSGPEWDKARREHREKMKAKANGSASTN